MSKQCDEESGAHATQDAPVAQASKPVLSKKESSKQSGRKRKLVPTTRLSQMLSELKTIDGDSGCDSRAEFSFATQATPDLVQPLRSQRDTRTPDRTAASMSAASSNAQIHESLLI